MHNFLVLVRKLKKHKLVLSLAISLLVAGFLSALFSGGVFYTYNIGLTDGLYGGRQASGEIIIIGIDDRSLQEIGRWPWDRNVHAALLDKLGNARVVGFDVSFFERSEHDTVLQQAINRAGNVVLVSEYLKFSQKNEKLFGEEYLEPVFSSRSGFA